MNSSDFDFIDCPNCGSTDFADITPGRHKCSYCGTILTSREPERAPDLTICPHCGQDNKRSARYCNRCGKTLTNWLGDFFKRTDPAVISIIVTLVGTFMIPMPWVSAILGLALGYKALKSAREGKGNSEKLAKWAVIIAWGTLAYTTLPLCLIMGGSSLQTGYSTCEGLSSALLNMLSEIGQ